MEVGQKFGAEFRIIQEAEHQKLGTSKKKQKGSSHCSDLQSTYICVWNIAMWHRKNVMAMSGTPAAVWRTRIEFMKVTSIIWNSTPKKCLWISGVKIEKNVKCHCQHIQNSMIKLKELELSLTFWLQQFPTVFFLSRQYAGDGSTRLSVQVSWANKPQNVTRIVDTLSFGGCSAASKTLRLVSSEGHSSGIRTGHIGGSVTQAFLAAWTTKCGPMELDSLRMSPEKEHNLGTLRPCFLLELMEKKKLLYPKLLQHEWEKCRSKLAKTSKKIAKMGHPEFNPSSPLPHPGPTFAKIRRSLASRMALRMATRFGVTSSFSSSKM